jgi:hypothetical protein
MGERGIYCNNTTTVPVPERRVSMLDLPTFVRYLPSTRSKVPGISQAWRVEPEPCRALCWKAVNDEVLEVLPLSMHGVRSLGVPDT